jgi:hypothetical protein
MTERYQLTEDGSRLAKQPEWSILEIKAYCTALAQTLKTRNLQLPESIQNYNLEAGDLPVSSVMT